MLVVLAVGVAIKGLGIPVMGWWINTAGAGGFWFVALPIVGFALLCVGFLCWRLRRDIRPLLRRLRGVCTACGYDRRGLSATSVCPECGTAGKAFIEP